VTETKGKENNSFTTEPSKTVLWQFDRHLTVYIFGWLVKNLPEIWTILTMEGYLPDKGT
jgi:hypothetical protein